ncbi:MAG TPA: bifunctional oligoribonuclease/PAP phosphatase NrnA [Anaerolineales bacterium]|jgi:phosphoesterase RecJ-like protein|nr:bifunctional oligoribonuclease/PAP phosphatase NrnA [Anaerolineales bacterium]
MDESLLQIVRKQVNSAQNLLVVSHVRPDGDAVGSLLGFGLSLQAAGKEVQMVLSDGVPGDFRHLHGSEHIRTQPEGTFDFVVTVDCSDLERTGSALNGYSVPDLNIDHHPTNLNFAKINLVEVEAVATSEMLAEYLPEFGLRITPYVAAALLNGIVTDTLGFRTYNMTPKALRVAADLVEAGAPLPELYHRSLLSRSFNALRYWGVGLSNLQREERMVWTSLSMEDRRAVSYPGRDDADLINILTTLRGADVVLIFVEQGNGRVKVSWRSQPGFDVSRIALEFGGGGHKAAAGAEIEGTLADVQEKVLLATRTLFDEI